MTENYSWVVKNFVFDIKEYITKYSVSFYDTKYLFVPFNAMQSVVRDISTSIAQDPIFMLLPTPPSVNFRQVEHNDANGVTSNILTFCKSVPELLEFSNYMDFSQLTNLFLVIPVNSLPVTDNQSTYYKLYWEELVVTTPTVSTN